MSRKQKKERVQPRCKTEPCSHPASASGIATVDQPHSELRAVLLMNWQRLLRERLRSIATEHFE